MKFEIIQHVSFEGPGEIETWLKQNKHSYNIRRMDLWDSLPPVESFDSLIVMGGPMGASDDSIYPWMSLEKQLIRDAIQSNKKVMGICLGSQLIASVLGAKVFRNSEKEIGWHSVNLESGTFSKELNCNIDSDATVFHWHGDAFGLPEGAKRLANSEATLNQGFLYKNHVLALLFHLEMNAVIIEGLLKHGADDLTDGLFVQTAKEIKAGIAANTPQTQKLLFSILDGFFKVS